VRIAEAWAAATGWDLVSEAYGGACRWRGRAATRASPLHDVVTGPAPASGATARRAGEVRRCMRRAPQALNPAARRADCSDCWNASDDSDAPDTLATFAVSPADMASSTSVLKDLVL